MTDSELLRLANQSGLEDSIVRDGEGGLANRIELARDLYRADMLTHAEWLNISKERPFKRVRMA